MTANLTVEHRGRLPALDGLRGIAALMILSLHALPGVAPSGLDAGVLLFFALSGYLLYAPFVGGPVDLRRYAIRRFLRITPAYLVAAIGIGFLFYPSMLGDPVGLITMTHTPIVVVWTLQIEVVFYASLPFIARFLRGRLLVLAIVSVLATVAIMVSSIGLIGYVPTTSLQTAPSLMWAFVPGMLVAELRPVRLGWWVLVAGIGLIVVSVIADPPPFFDFPAGLGAGLVVAFAVSRPALPRRLTAPAMAAGALSYSVYLWHEAIVATGAPWPIVLAVSVVVAAIIYILIERPSIRLASWLTAARPRPPVVVAERVVGAQPLTTLEPRDCLRE